MLDTNGKDDNAIVELKKEILKLAEEM